MTIPAAPVPAGAPVVPDAGAALPFVPQAVPPATLTLPDGRTLIPEAGARPVPPVPPTSRAAIEAERARRQAQTAASGAPAPASEGAPAAQEGGVPDEMPATEGVESETLEGTEHAETGEGGENTEPGEVVDPNDPNYFELPPRTPNGKPIGIVAGDPEVLEGLRRLQNGYLRGEEARRAQEAVQQITAEYEDFETELMTDPAGVVLKNINVEQGKMLARTLLSIQPVWEALQDELLDVLGVTPELRDQLADAVRERETFVLRAKNARSELKDQAAARVSQARVVRQNARDINAALHRLMPEHLSNDEQQTFLRYARFDLAEFQRAQQVDTVPPNQVPQIIAPLLKRYGVDPAARLRRSPASAAPAAAGAAAPEGAPAPASRPTAPRTLDNVRAADRTRRLVAANSPSSQSNVRQGPLDTIPSNAGIKEATRHLRSAFRSRPR